jgi:hypothetical protein
MQMFFSSKTLNISLEYVTAFVNVNHKFTQVLGGKA